MRLKVILFILSETILRRSEHVHVSQSFHVGRLEFGSSPEFIDRLRFCLVFKS